MSGRPLPPARDLTRAQYDGRACVWCRNELSRGAQSAGTARGSIGSHVLDVEVFSCPNCHTAPAAGAASRPAAG